MAFKRNVTDLHWFGNTEFDTKSGFMYLIQANQAFHWNVDSPWSGYHILISPLLLQENQIGFSFFNYEIREALFLTENEQLRIETLFEQVYNEYQKDDYSMDLLMAYCNLFLTYVQKCYERQFKTREPLYNKIVVAFKKELNNYYLEHPKQLPSVNYFADNLHLSSNYFSDLIKYNTGKTALELIHEKIISEAKNQLKNMDKSISEVAHALGFDYPTYFTRLFRKHVGCTPSQYREKL
ncbi:AraC family transcriptional regulator [Marinifilum sp. JC070]|uniref:AraC family transcriptional regulator n=2 Tax=Marinifilum caeruleilacunae TaxID=2499076 RepID=A0ABX1WQV0_9BACT|nr:AraC family transcriptional regulator [Marinifilum caeruleilacunae]